jgi:hypothetical protein
MSHGQWRQRRVGSIDHREDVGVAERKLPLIKQELLAGRGTST